MKNDHTVDSIEEELTRVCRDWKVLNKVCFIVTDNGANIVAAVTKVMQKRQLPCPAHTVNLVVHDAIRNTNKVKNVQEKIKRIVSYFHQCVKSTDKLSEMQYQNNVQR